MVGDWRGDRGHGCRHRRLAGKASLAMPAVEEGARLDAKRRHMAKFADCNDCERSGDVGGAEIKMWTSLPLSRASGIVPVRDREAWQRCQWRLLRHQARSNRRPAL